ncbi:N-acetylmuramoyl-L-alanine amidase [Burkholderia gladioli]|uniref:N-acetylmuramoyl-L-alanine amidase n=2 Tax=Burkholderia gladioli TaxID=28095 RepID=A0A2A7S3T2_BURGA|nr:N-acetylmuramoyl-L-alanine amidase [Burkholderia gladioli]PEH38334.1 cell wall hydrolase [Burkholderia gladioli]QPQ84699.1 N-acetylmuramoyl-L-alanine amidase [Burkholderia gladioli]
MRRDTGRPATVTNNDESMTITSGFLRGTIALAGALALVCASATTACAAPSTIVVDTGHTPAHPGATGASGRVEYRYNLDLSAAVAAELGAHGEHVLRTSADGREIALSARSARANDAHADLFVSIHHDSIQQAYLDAGRQREFHGYAIFVSERNPRYAASLRCAREIGETPSLYHADPIRGENRPLIDARLGIHRFDDLVVLRTARVPALLIEAGVIVNPQEEARLAQADTIRRLGAAIAAGIEACTAA